MKLKFSMLKFNTSEINLNLCYPRNSKLTFFKDVFEGFWTYPIVRQNVPFLCKVVYDHLNSKTLM